MAPDCKCKKRHGGTCQWDKVIYYRVKWIDEDSGIWIRFYKSNDVSISKIFEETSKIKEDSFHISDYFWPIKIRHSRR